MSVEEIDSAIQKAKDNGIQNILCLRGDPPNFLKGNTEWKETEGGFRYAKDLVRFIREKYGDYFGLAVAGYPEGHPDGSYDEDLQHLKEKVDAGADFVVSQLFYDVDQFLKFVSDCRKIGINCPILPGIMPINNYASWNRMISFCKCKIPEKVTKALESINTEDDVEVRQFGINLGIDMCRRLIANGIRGLHLYTLNLEKSCLDILEGLNLNPQSIQRALPWKATANAHRIKEDVRPIFWSNRPISYVERTNEWDEFPNGRWGDSYSPAFGQLSDFHLLGIYSRPADKRKSLWGKEIESIEDVNRIFSSYLKGEINALPWCDKEPGNETSIISDELIKLNENGVLTINSQPRVNGADSSDPTVGWGPAGGRVYQKAYLEFFCSEEIVNTLWNNLKNFPSLSMHAINKKGDSKNSSGMPTSTAVTWGVFPNSQIKQPTVVDTESFIVWKDEAFGLWNAQWADLYEEGSASRNCIQKIIDSYYLVHIVDNDFQNGDIFNIFKASNIIN